MRHPALAAAILAVAAAFGAAAQPAARWLTSEVDFGAFNEAVGTATTELMAVNDGTEPLLVVTARSNCGCTKPAYSPMPVAPGDTLKVAVGYNAAGRPGKFIKRVTIDTNEPASYSFTVKGTVIPGPETLKARFPVDAGAVALHDHGLFFGNLTPTGVSSQWVEGINTRPDTLILAIERSPAWVSAMVRPDTIGPGEQFVISATGAGAQLSQWDFTADTLVIAARSPAMAPARVTLPATATLVEAFAPQTSGAPAPQVRVNPDLLDFDLTAGKPATLSFEISNIGRKELNIRRIYSVDPAVSLTGRIPTQVKPGKKATVQVTVDPVLLAGRDMLNSRLLVITDDPLSPRRSIRLTAPLP